MAKEISNKVEIHLNQSIEAGRRTQQKLQTKNEDRKKKLEHERVSAMAKTHADWKQNMGDMEGDEDDEDDDDGLTESYHTLKRKGSQENDLASPEIGGMSKDGPQVTLLKADLPSMFQKSTLTGFKNLKESGTGVPSCFCEKQGVCKKHTQFEPTIESMIELLEEQVTQLNKDERSLEDNLDFIGKSMESILLSRRDTFKEQITRAYASKEEELEFYKSRCEEMEQHEVDYQKSVVDKQELASTNVRLQEQLSRAHEDSVKESTMLVRKVLKATTKKSGQDEKYGGTQMSQSKRSSLSPANRTNGNGGGGNGSSSNLEEEMRQMKEQLRKTTAMLNS